MAKGTHGMSDLELAILTPSEREALDEESSEEERAAQAAVKGGTMPGEGDENEDDTAIAPKAADVGDLIEPGKPATAAVVAEAPPTAAGEPVAAVVDSAKSEGLPREPFAARMQVAEGEPVDYDKQLAELQQKFDDGELSTGEYNKQFAHLVQERTTADLTAKFNAGIEEQLWLHDKGGFFEGHPEYLKSRALYGALGAEITAIEEEGEKAGGQRLSGPKLLAEAHGRVMKEFGQVPPAARAEGQKPKAPSSKAGEPPDLTKIPVTLAGVPTAAEAETGKDRFAEIDKLAETDAMAFEQALAKMSAADQQAYLSLS